ncbi:hypothetical protein EOPP23_04450 [Endozoicomonas sp. OPT23]|uniref:cytochrome b562 n=1 Tax=Endozoicomonas sp. OPT23 TaxID=2072845 RepID=UPI00129A39DA|nr:cytochrome b562 [Endozoicomonas sp. OPT23]MRI32243.1 hypothetical protein [Endozoicomonas sp. OPT23]
MTKRFLSLFLPLLLTLTGSSSMASGHEYHSDQMRAEMKQMNWNLRRTAKAENIEQLQKYLNEIKRHAKNASADANDHAPSEFKDGMKELQRQINSIQAAIDSGDMDLARKQFKALNKLKKKYHVKLDV